MTLLSRKADYALLILSYLYSRAEPACAREIAEHYNLSRGFVANILKELCSKGFLASTRGAKGGYVPQRSADEISLAELLDSLEDGFRVASCTGGDKHTEECALMPICPVRTPIGELHRRLNHLLHGVMLSELFTVPEVRGHMVPPPALVGVRS